jgi:hypothetical protein
VSNSWLLHLGARTPVAALHDRLGEIDTNAQIRLLVKLKLTICARAGDRAGHFFVSIKTRTALNAQQETAR